MFGRNKLTHEGTATVVSSSSANHHVTWTSGGFHYSKFDLVLDVQPLGAMAFRAPAEASFAIMYSPDVGEQLKVRCNPETQKVEVDVDDDPRFNVKLQNKVQHDTLEAQRQRDLAAPPGTPPASQTRFGSSPGSDEMLDPELRELMRLEEEERRRGGQPGA